MPRITPGMMATAKRAAMLGSAGAAAYVTHDALDYLNLKENMPASQAPQRTKRPLKTAEHKEWTLYGRQSPGFVRDANKNSKSIIREKIKSSSLLIDELGTQMDNEKHYALFEGTDFCVEPMTSNAKAPQVMLPPEKMKSTNLDELPENLQFEVGFARKQGFADITSQSPFYHSSIALREISTEHPASEGALIMTGREIKEVMKKTNDNICGKQHCTLVQSNCYTASIYTLGEMIKTIHHRSGNPEAHAEDIQKVADILGNAAFENFGRGVSNNPELSDFLTKEITPIITQHQKLTQTAQQKLESEDEHAIQGILSRGLPHG